MASPPATSPPSPDATPSSPPSTSPPAPQSPPPSDSTPPPSMSPPPPGASPTPPPSPPASSTPGGQAAPPTKSSGSQPPPSPPPQARGGSSSPVSQESPPAPRRSGGSASGGSKGGSGDGGDRGSGSSSGSSATGAMVAGVVIAVVVFAVLLLASACCCFAKKRKKKRPPPMSHIPYYTDEKGHVYYANGGAPPKWQQHSGSPGLAGIEHNLPPPPGWHHHHAGHPLSTPLGSNAAPLSGEMGATTTGPYSGPHGPPLPPPSPNVALGFTKSAFTYEELAAATGGFAAANMLGQGGFGYVYKGVLAGSGKEVAVKQLKTGSGQGEREFQAEVEIISRVHHRHLVSLVGYCIAGSQRLLVYEFVPNQTLEHHLHGKGMPVMEWSRRHKIALGSAKGLAYLHEDCHPRIIHRDIKTANILLDNNFEAMVADFGLAKLTTDTNTHVSTRVMGTFGYLAPEYASSGKLTEKSDVFSFGVMLLELITGRRPIDTSNYMEDSLVDWARPLLAGTLSGEASFEELVDARLEKNYSPVELERMAASAAACIRHSARRRPKMSQIVRALEGDVSLEALNEGVKPGQSMLFSSGGSDANNITRLRQLAFDSGDYSDDYSITTSEHSGDSEATQRHK